MGEWKLMDSAPKDGTSILIKFKSSVQKNRDDLAGWNGLMVICRHPGIADDGFDIGWNVAGPVGYGGFPDEWIEAWMPLPSPPTL